MRPASAEAVLHLIKLLPRDNRFMVVLHQILRELATVFAIRFRQMVNPELFLEQQIALILLIAQDFVDRIVVPQLADEKCVKSIREQFIRSSPIGIRILTDEAVGGAVGDQVDRADLDVANRFLHVLRDCGANRFVAGEIMRFSKVGCHG